jgi:hypothetical protein
MGDAFAALFYEHFWMVKPFGGRSKSNQALPVNRTMALKAEGRKCETTQIPHRDRGHFFSHCPAANLGVRAGAARGRNS